MAKPKRGGQRVPGSASRITQPRATAQQVQQSTPQPIPVQPAPAPAPVQPAPQPTPAQVASGNIMPPGGVPFSTFEKMTDDQKAQVVTDALKQGVPMFLDDSDIQRFAYFTGMNDKPQVVTEAQLNAMKGRSLWRSVHDSYNPATDIGYKAKDIYDQIAKGDYTNFSDTGGSAHGKAIYFDVTKGSYGAGGRYSIIHAKLAPGAKTIIESRLDSLYASALASKDKLALACKKADRLSARNLYALCKGYDVIVDNQWSSYHMVLNRRALIVSDTIH